MSIGLWDCYACKRACKCQKCTPPSIKLAGLKRKIKQVLDKNEDEEDEDFDIDADPKKFVKTSELNGVKSDLNSQYKLKKLKILRANTPLNINKTITRSEKLEINTTYNTTNNGAKSGSSVKIITEIKSDECIYKIVLKL